MSEKNEKKLEQLSFILLPNPVIISQHLIGGPDHQVGNYCWKQISKFANLRKTNSFGHIKQSHRPTSCSFYLL